MTAISPTWFEYVGDSDLVGHANAPGLTSEMVRDSEATPTDSDATSDVFDWIVRFDTKSLENADVTTVGKTASLLVGDNIQFEVIRGLGLVGQVLVRSSGATADLVETWLADNSHVASYELDSLNEVQATPSDSYYSYLWGMENNGQTGGTSGADIDAEAAWNISTGSSSIVVGVIDTGVDYTHPDLVSNIWTNPGEIAGNGIDDDGNGFVDDVHGFDFVNNDGDPMDDNNHGTHVSGTIAAAGNNNLGVTGVNWSSSIMALKFLSADGSGYTSDAVRAVNYATMMRTSYGIDVRVTNNSWGGGSPSTAMEDAIRASGDAGILFVAAAGNDGTDNDASPHYPSNYALDNVLSVAATDASDNLASFSNYGQTTVHLAAPGVSILSTIAGGGYAFFSGTSMATPHVAGVAALAWSVDPDATVAEIRTALLQGTDTLGSLAGKCTTAGRLNALGTLELLSNQDPSAPVIASLEVTSNYVTPGVSTTLTASGVSDSDGTVSAVAFYQDANGDGQYDEGDTLLAQNAVTNSEASYELATDDLEPGNYVFFARAVDDQGQWSQAARTVLVIVVPDDHGNNAAGATLVSVGDTVSGAIQQNGDVDWFAFTATAGAIYRFETTLGTLADSHLSLVDQDGTTILEDNDDILWPDNLASRTTWMAPASGTYYLVVEPEEAGQLGEYTLQLVDLSGVVDDHGDEAATATAISIGSTLGGELEWAWDEDWFSFEAVAGTGYLFEIGLGDLADSELYLYDSDGTTLLDYNDDADWGSDLSSRLAWTAESDGTYFLAVESYGSDYSGSYTLTATTVTDDHGNSPATATAISVGDTVAGEIEFGSDVDFFAVELQASGRYAFQTTLLDLSDSVLYLYGPDGWTLLDLGDDIAWPDDPSSRIEWVAETSGTYYLAVEAYDLTDVGTYTLDVELINFLPVLEPLDDCMMELDDDALGVTLTAHDADGDALTYSVHVLGTDPYAERAYALDQELGFYQHAIGYLENAYGAGEKFLASDAGWHFVLPNGELYRWEGTIDSSVLVATFSPRYHLDPALLHDAVLPVSPDNVSLSLDGNTLTIDPADGFHETFSVRVEVSDGTDTSFGTFQVAWNMPEAIDLGSVDYREIRAEPATSNPVWYRLVATHDGYLSIEATVPLDLAGDLTLRLRNEQYTEVGVWNTSSAESRLDFQVRAGETYFVEVVGQADLVLANLVQHEEDTVTVHGTEEEDRFVFAVGEQYSVVVNGVAYDFTRADIASVVFDGGNGQDTAIVEGSTADETVFMRVDSTTFVGPDYHVEIAGAERVDAYGGGGFDRAYLYDSAGDDRFFAGPEQSSFEGAGVVNAAWGFDRVNAFANEGGNDQAHLYDSSGDDRFYGTVNRSCLLGNGFYIAVWGLEEVDAVASSGGNDQAFLYDSSGDDRLYSRPDQSCLLGNGFSCTAWGFEDVSAFADSGGNDQAYFYDSPGDDRFYGRADRSYLIGEGFSYTVSGFDRVNAFSNQGGNDRAYFSGSTGDDYFHGEASRSCILGDGFFNAAWGFEYVNAFANEGGHDHAYFHGSPGDDYFYGDVGRSYILSDGFYGSAWGFEEVDALDSGGNDQAYLYDSAGNERFYGRADRSYLLGDGFSYTAWGFDRVNAFSNSGGSDRAYFSGSTGDDSFHGALTRSCMIGENFYSAAWGFERVNAFANEGGHDLATLYGSPGDDSFYGDVGRSYILADGFFGSAWGFEEVDAIAGDGGNDQACLYDSPGDERFYGRADRSYLLGNGFSYTAWGFDRVDAFANEGGNDCAYFSGSAGDDYFHGGASQSYYLGEGFLNTAWGFDRVNAFTNGEGNDRACLYDSPGDDYFNGDLGRTCIFGAGFYNAAWGFGQVDVFANSGGNDRAYLYDSALDDRLEASENRLTLDYGSSAISLYDFDWCQASSVSGGNDHRVIDAIDFILELLGDWMDE